MARLIDHFTEQDIEIWAQKKCTATGQMIEKCKKWVCNQQLSIQAWYIENCMHVTPFSQDNGLPVFNKKVTSGCGVVWLWPTRQWMGSSSCRRQQDGSAPSAHVGERPQHPLLRLLLLPLLHELPHLLILLSKHFLAPSGKGNFKGELWMKQKCLLCKVH